MIFESPGMLHGQVEKVLDAKKITEDYLTSKKTDCMFCGAISGSLSLRKTKIK